MAPPRGVPRQFPKRLLDTRAQTRLVERVAEDRVGGGGRRARPKPVDGGAEHERAHLQGAWLGLGQVADATRRVAQVVLGDLGDGRPSSSINTDVS